MDQMHSKHKVGLVAVVAHKGSDVALEMFGDSVDHEVCTKPWGWWGRGLLCVGRVLAQSKASGAVSVGQVGGQLTEPAGVHSTLRHYSLRFVLTLFWQLARSWPSPTRFEYESDTICFLV